MLHVSSLGSRMTIHPAQKAQLVLLFIEKIIVLAKYLNFANVFLQKSANVFPERSEANEHAIKLEKGKQPPYGPIYSLKPVGLKTLKTYIKINLVNGFIQASKSLAGVPILFVRKSNDNFCLYVNY